MAGSAASGFERPSLAIFGPGRVVQLGERLRDVAATCVLPSSDAGLLQHEEML